MTQKDESLAIDSCLNIDLDSLIYNLSLSYEVINIPVSLINRRGSVPFKDFSVHFFKHRLN